MKKIILIILLTYFNIAAYNQVIRGTILDKQTHNRISTAMVYISGTFVQTKTDMNGHFELDISKFITMPLTISSSGYYSVTFSVVSPEKPVLIYLKSKEDKLIPVVSTSKADVRSRTEDLILFKKTLLGKSWNITNCKIRNENDITFISDNDTLKAFSSKPIIIDNSALGYELTYFLEKFEFYKQSNRFFLSGNISFDKDLNTGDTKKWIFKIRRKKAYIGSRMYFFRTLWENSLDSAKISIKNSEDEFLSYNQIVSQDDSLKKYLKYPERKDVNQRTSAPPFYIVFSKVDVYNYFNQSSVSLIYLEKDTFFDKNGYFDPSFISWQGKMAKQRLKDLLPYEYSIR